ncbi:MAG: hypothetical protein KDB22_28675 [Planctomycetales bacterium]|nr:hypothetical protein [Planctomycetales bacterium]
MKFTATHRETLGGLADQLIPPDEKMPSASQADVMGQGLDQVLKARPDLAEPLRKLLNEVEGVDSKAVLGELMSENSGAMGVLAEVVCGAYFMNPAVQAALGYTGQGPTEMEPRPDYMEDGLLESVIRRGPIFRPTPHVN